ncbi:aminotransferase class-V family protein [Orientia chuto str. Dubai]|uniref:Cysteine desulfurase n=1 Tax=Orientia chuto str. Dubai TaxID=1359168 RepID=A0A0F3MRQ8_9RICK|nr:cysteine desulfurase family protein [Candidatus Orientia mediorientalis]KJV57284.1 aminotransferase class-V family protein [Orientia chuto str. Dubai]
MYNFDAIAAIKKTVKLSNIITNRNNLVHSSNQVNTMQKNKKIYFDYNATTPIHSESLEVMLEVLNIPANPSSIHYFGQVARGFIEKARLQIANKLDISLNNNKFNCIFVSSGTEANNLLLTSFKKVYKNGVIVTCTTEHPSILNCAQSYNDTQIIDVDERGIVDLIKLQNTLFCYQNLPLLVTIMLVNNETGVIQPLEEIINLAKKYQAWVHSDCSQAFGKISVNFTQLCLDFATISSHKIGGPVGAASLIARVPNFITPQIIGGGQEDGIRSGTENVAAIAGFGKAVELLPRILEKSNFTKELKQYLEAKISSIDNRIKIFGQNTLRVGNTSMIMMPGVTSQQQILYFDINGFAISAGSACSSGQLKESYVLKAMKIPIYEAECAIRISLGWCNTEEEIKKFCELWQKQYLYHIEVNNIKKQA